MNLLLFLIQESCLAGYFFYLKHIKYWAKLLFYLFEVCIQAVSLMLVYSEQGFLYFKALYNFEVAVST